jgi:hypothetical protein
MFGRGGSSAPAARRWRPAPAAASPRPGGRRSAGASRSGTQARMHHAHSKHRFGCMPLGAIQAQIKIVCLSSHG